MLAIAAEVRSEWTLRSYWVGDKVRSEARVTADELADLVRRSELNRYVVYRVTEE